MSNKWRVPNFASHIIISPKMRKRKRKTGINKSKYDTSKATIENIQPQTPVLPETCTELSSPIIGNYKNTPPDNTNQYYFINSPVLNTKLTYSQSDSELDTSPVINRNIKKIIKLRKGRLSSLKKQENCIRKLNELQDENSDKENRIRKVCKWMDEEENYKIEVDSSQPTPNGTLLTNNMSKTNHENNCFRKSWMKIGNVGQNCYKTRDNDNSLLNINYKKEVLENNWINTNNKSNSFDKTTCSKHDESLQMDLLNSQNLFENNSPSSTANRLVPVANPIWNFNILNENCTSLTSLESLLTHKFPASNEVSILNTPKEIPKYETKKSNRHKTPFHQLYSQQEEFEIEMMSSQDCSSISQNLKVSNDISSQNIDVPDNTPSQKSKDSLSPKTDGDFCKIESTSSHPSSVVTISSNYTVVPDSMEGSSYETLYNSPKKNRKYKPGTLGHQFHKLLRRQKANIGIWRHELYLSNTSGYQIPVSRDDHHLITTLTVTAVLSDFSSAVFECSELLTAGCKCLVIANLTWSPELSVEVGTVVKIYPPYFVKYYNVSNEENVKTYVNVHKIVRIKN